MPEPILDIVIPSFRGRYLRETLEGFAAQTSREFRLIVADDASPDDISAICAPFAGTLDLLVHRFPANLGGTDLVGHWTRAVELGEAPWVWLFSDDDVASPDCVRALLDTIASVGPSCGVLRFQTSVIDAAGRVGAISPPHPPSERPADFLYHRLRGVRESFAPEYVFSRAAFRREGGFVRFPAAWCTDDASWCAFAGDHPIVTVPSGRIHWRLSGTNISSRGQRVEEKLLAAVGFLEWIEEKGWFRSQEWMGPDRRTVVGEQRGWMWRQVSASGGWGGFRGSLHLSKRLAALWGDGSWKLLLRILQARLAGCVARSGILG